MVLRVGDLVYIVTEVDPPTRGPHTWEVTSFGVTYASAKQIKLDRCAATLWSTRYQPDALGRIFFETPDAAIAAFLTAKRSNLESLERRRTDTERAITWAINQGSGRAPK